MKLPHLSIYLDWFHISSICFTYPFPFGFALVMVSDPSFYDNCGDVFLLWYHGTDVIEKHSVFMELPQKQSAWTTLFDPYSCKRPCLVRRQQSAQKIRSHRNRH